MNVFTNFLEEKFMPIAGKLSSNRYLKALRDGLALSMPVIIIGSLATVIGSFPIPGYKEFMVSVFGENWAWWNWDVINPATTGLIALFAVVGVSYNLAKSFDKEPLAASALSITAYFILIHQMEGGGYAPADFESTGLFSAMIVALITTRIYVLVLDKKLVIKMPDTVPPAIASSFTALVPAAIIIPFFTVIRYLFTLTPYISANGFILEVLQAPLTGIGTTLIGTIVATFITGVLWCVGVHGDAVVCSVMTPIWKATMLSNLEAFKATGDLPYIVTQQFMTLFVYIGGTGVTLPLAGLMAFGCKSKQVTQLGRLAITPSIFNVNEPVIFGLPIVMNPVLMIPFVVAPIVVVITTFVSMDMGLVGKPLGIAVPWTTPALFSGYLATGDFKAVILQAVNLLLAGAIYFPFLRAWDRKIYAEEQVEVIDNA